MPSTAAVVSLPQGASIARLNLLIKAVEDLRNVYADMTLNQLQVLLLIAANPGITQRQIMEETGLPDSSTSRIVSIMGKFGNRGTGPFNLIDLVPSETDRRYKGLHLTKKGRALVEKLVDHLRR